MTSFPLIVAHRGARDEAPENTASAFDRALLHSVDGIELDVQMTRDSVPVIYHDRTLYHVLRRFKRLSDFTLDELLSLDFGSWYSSKYTGEPVLTLRQTLEQYLPRTRLFIEIKSRPKDRTSGRSLKVAEKAVQEILRTVSLDLVKHVRVLSFDLNVLTTASRMAPDLFYVWNLPDKYTECAQAVAHLYRNPAMFEFVRGVCFRISRMNQDSVCQVRDAGKQILTYSCNGPRQTVKALKLNADVVMTDRPGWMFSFLQKRRVSID